MAAQDARSDHLHPDRVEAQAQLPRVPQPPQGLHPQVPGGQHVLVVPDENVPWGARPLHLAVARLEESVDPDPGGVARDDPVHRPARDGHALAGVEPEVEPRRAHLPGGHVLGGPWQDAVIEEGYQAGRAVQQPRAVGVEDDNVDDTRQLHQYVVVGVVVVATRRRSEPQEFVPVHDLVLHSQIAGKMEMLCDFWQAPQVYLRGRNRLVL
mmetsp:Transcript_30985/g.81450  ORF Transcript_30985/g.81450 Transcript_30985/m.81450 type:complete len:210 (+) Transcript_30985:136-765(+)